jgi:hypothetical protein
LIEEIAFIAAGLIRIIFMDRVFDLSGHEGIRGLLKDTQTGAGTEIDTLAAV